MWITKVVQLGDGERGNPTVTEESVNIDKCAALQTRAMKRMELKSYRPLKVSSVDGSGDRTSAVNCTEVRRDSETILAVSRQGINRRLTQVCGNTFAPISHQRTISRPIWSFAGTHGHITVLALYSVYTITGCQTGCNRIDNRLYRVNKHPTSCQTGCQTGLTD